MSETTTTKRTRTPQTYQLVQIHRPQEGEDDVNIQDVMDVVERTLEEGGVVLTSLPMPEGVKPGNRTAILNKVKSLVRKSTEETPSVYAGRPLTVVSYPTPQTFISEASKQKDKERIAELEAQVKALQEQQLQNVG